MKFSLPQFATFASTLGLLFGLAACGGSDSPSTPTPTTPAAESPATLTKTDIVVGTGAEAVAGKAVTVNYTGWLYTTSVATFKGAQFDSSVGKSPLPFVVGTNAVIAGFDQGTLGMKVGGKRTVLIPSSLGYGAVANGSIPANSGLVFEIELLSVK